MDEKMLEALQGSVEKWRLIEAGEIGDEGAANCPLCNYTDDCQDCPVYERTGFSACEGTPYYDFVEVGTREYDEDSGKLLGKFARSPSAVARAGRMREFLESLIPREDPELDRLRAFIVKCANAEGEVGFAGPDGGPGWEDICACVEAGLLTMTRAFYTHMEFGRPTEKHRQRIYVVTSKYTQDRASCEKSRRS